MSVPVGDTTLQRFAFEIDGFASLTVAEIWPDGDAPENPTEADVVKRIQARWRDVPTFLRDWNLEGDVTVHVDGERALPR